MSTTLDGQNLFGEQELEIQPASVSRDSAEKTVAGLDGVLSIDLGRRGRKVKQRGVLLAKSRQRMDEKISAITAFIDGGTHKLVTNGGQEFDNLRMDTFEATKERASGGGLCCNYEIVYMQLVV